MQGRLSPFGFSGKRERGGSAVTRMALWLNIRAIGLCLSQLTNRGRDWHGITDLIVLGLHE